jgi:hypothetical protein
MPRTFRKRMLARICKVSPGTIEKWFWGKRLRGWLDADGNICVTRDSLIRFLRDHAMDSCLPNIPAD